MIWLVVVAVVVVVLVVLALGRHDPPQQEITYRVMIDLYAIRRRFDLARFKFDIRRDAANLRREMRAELRRLDEWADR